MTLHQSIGRRSPDLLRLADKLIQPGFQGTSPPDWLRRRLAAGLGGVALFGRNIEDLGQVAELTAALRAENPDVLVAIDEEAGDVTRLEVRTGSSRPGSLALGAVDDLELTEQVATDLGRMLAGVGVNLDYAPSADVNSNIDNPVIGVRSFGATADLVARHTVAWVRGLQSTGVAACAKHFPGHGDTGVDSHLNLPVLAGTAEQIAEVALVPFRAAIDAGVRAIMTGHLLVPGYDRDRPATMSRRVLVDLLRTELGFDGLVITDGIEMKAVSDRYGVAGASVLAIAAGADAICVGGGLAGEDTAEEIQFALVDAVTDGTMPAERLAEAADRVDRLAGWIREAAVEPVDRPADQVPIGLVAARRAVRLVGSEQAGLPLTGAPHVVQFVPGMSLAVAAETPWGIAATLAQLLPGTTSVRLGPDAGADDRQLDELAMRPAIGRPLVLVARDAHRHPWMACALRHLLRERPDAGVVEMGVPGPAAGELGAWQLFTYGATRVSGQAAAELLAGHPTS